MIERYVQGSGLRVCLCEWGDPTDPTVIILHGYLDQGAAWTDVAEGLVARGLHVLAPDHRGHGRSDHVPAGGYYHFPDYLRDLDAWTADLAPFALVGHSMGGTVACMYAGVRPERVRALALVEGTGPHSVGDEDAPQQLLTHLNHVARLRPHSAMPDVDDAAARLRRFNPDMRPALARQLAERATEPHPDGGVRWRWDPLHRTRAAAPFSLARFLHFLARVKAPTSTIIGTKSPFQPDQLDARLAALPVIAQHTLDCGHNPHFDRPDALAALIAGAGSS